MLSTFGLEIITITNKALKFYKSKRIKPKYLPFIQRLEKTLK